MSQPPLPVGAPDDVTFSELVPLGSRKISIWRSRALIPLAATALTCVLLFVVRFGAHPDLWMAIVAAFVVFVMFAAIYSYIGERKLMLWYLVPALLAYVQLRYLLGYYDVVFIHLLPGKAAFSAPKDFPSAFTAFLFAAGLREELLKATPVLAGLAIALLVRRSGGRGNVLTRGLGVEGPVDGLLMGVAAGAAFILGETLGQYVPRTIAEVLKTTSGNEGMAYLFGLALLLPRVLNGIIGHMAWAGIFGYFIGLAATHPRAAWKLLPLGWLVSALLHTLWDSLDTLLGETGYWVSAVLTLIIFVACLLKAKQLEVSRLGGPVDGRSILALSPPFGTLPPGPAGVVPPPAPGLAGAFTRVASTLEGAVGVTARTTVPTAGTPVGPAGIPPRGVSIGTGAVRYALEADCPIDLSGLFAEAGVPPGGSGAIVAGPGGFEIANTGQLIWAVASPAGETRSVPPGARFAAIPGTRLTLGPATLALEPY